MRVGLVCPYDLSRPGGVQAQVKELSRHLSRTGDEVLVLGPGLPGDVTGVDLGRAVSVRGNRSRVPLSPNPRVGRLIERACADLDLLHVHEPLMPFVSLSALRAGVPVVATFHAAPGAIGASLYRTLGNQVGRVLGPHVRRVTAVSRTAAAPLPTDLGITIVPNGVDVAAFAVDVERKANRVVFLGRDEKRKGLDILLHAWVTVSSSSPDAELVVMGADRSHPSIEWWGPVDDERKAEGLASSAIYVAPNLGGESFGIVLVEGMAAGAAVLASDLPSFQEVGGDAARYFATGDSDALADALSDLLADRPAVDRLSEAGRARARQFDWPAVAAAYRTVYEEALS